MKNILVAARHPGAANAVIPVVKNLRSLGHKVTVIGVDNQGADKPFGGSYAEFQKAGITDALDVRRDLGYQGDLTAMPIDFVYRTLVDGVNVILAGTSKDASGTHIGIEETAIASTPMRHTPSVLLVDSWGSWYPKNIPDAEFFTPTVYAVMDNLSRTILVSKAVPDYLIEVTGQPAFDAKANLVLRREETRSKLGLDEAQRLILYAGQVTPDNPTTLDWVVSNLGENDKLVFSRHPRDEREYGSILEKAGAHYLETSMKTDNVVHGADIHVTHFSTTGIDSVLLGVPSINLMLREDEREVRKLARGYPLAVMGLSYEVGNAVQYAGAISDITANPHKFLDLRERARNALRIDGKATERVTNLVLDSAA